MQTEITIHKDQFYINGQPTYSGRKWNGNSIEGLLFNSRMVQGVFDDLNPETAGRWAYPDTGTWDAQRNTDEFIAAMPLWRDAGLLAFTINLQGGSPQGYSKEQPWHNSAITPQGELQPDYMQRLEQILNKADALGMAVILGIFYFGQDHRLKEEAAVCRALDNCLEWLKQRDYTNIMIEINNECNVRYTHSILQPQRVHELILQAQANADFPVSTSYGGGFIPLPNVVATADYILMHGNGVEDPEQITAMVQAVRALECYSPKPVLINEDDHFDFETENCNMKKAIESYCSWGYFDPGQSNYHDGYQCPPVQWGINTERKKAFFDLVKVMTTN